MCTQTNLEHQGRNRKSLLLSFWLNLLFSILEAIGGLWTNSTAILTDAFHDFMDALSIGMAIQAEKLATRKRSAVFSYGYKRFSLLSAFVMSLILLIGAVFMAYKGIAGLHAPKEINSLGMLLLALIGLGVNAFAFLKVRHGVGHHHAHHHGGGNLNTRAIMLHLLEDVLGWAAVLIGAGIMYLTGWYWMDGVLTLGIALFIGFNACKNLIRTLKIMLQAIPEHIHIDQVKTALLGLQGVVGIHDLHVWSLDGNYQVASLHVVIGDRIGFQQQKEIRQQIQGMLQQAGMQHPTIQMETSAEACMFKSC